MQNDDVIWQIINHQFCSFKSKVAKEHTFCQNPYSVSGLCIRSACPLANSSYATIREEEGTCYLFIKTIERAHSPKNLWEKIKLPSNYMKALEIVSTRLEYFPKYLVHRNKQRLTKIHQMLIRMRKLKLKARPTIVTTNTKVDRREIGKERKALKAAQLDRAIEAELLERLRQVTEGEIYNYPEAQYAKALNKAANKYSLENKKNKAALKEGEEEDEEDGEEEVELEEEDEEGEYESQMADSRGRATPTNSEYDDEEDGEEEDEEVVVEYVEDLEESDDEQAEDIEEVADRLSLKATANTKKRPASSGLSAADKKKKALQSPARSKARVAVEYEHEEEDEDLQRQALLNSRLNSGRSAVRSQDQDYNF